LITYTPNAVHISRATADTSHPLFIYTPARGEDLPATSAPWRASPHVVLRRQTHALSHADKT
jgi:hypothetical protein